MASNPWEDFGGSSDALPVSYKKESDLKAIAAFSPESQAQINQQELDPQNDIELDKEIARTKNPSALFALQQEKDRRAQLKQTSQKQDSNPWDDFHSTPWDDFKSGSSFGDKVKGTLGAVGDFIAPVGTAYGGIHGLVDLATGQGLDKAVQDIHEGSKFNPSHLLMDNPEENATYNTLNTPLEKLGEFADTAGGKVTDLTGSPLAGTAANVGIQGLAMALGLKAAKGVLPKRGVVVEPKAEASTAKNVVNELLQRDGHTYEGGVDFKSETVPTEGTAKPYQYENPVPYEPDSIIRGDDPTPRSDFRTFERSGTLPETSRNIDYTDAIPFEEAPNVGTQLDGLLEPPKESGPAPEALIAKLEEGRPPTTEDLFGPENLADVRKGQDIEAAYRQKEADDRAAARNEPAPPVRDRADEPLQEPSQGSQSIEKITDPVTNRNGKKFYRQRGESDLIKDISGAVYDGAVKIGQMVRDISGQLGRVIGEDRNGYRVKTEVDGGYIYSTLPKAGRKIDLGEEVKLPDGRQGTVRATSSDTTKIAIPRDGGYDLVNVPTPQVSLLPKHNMFPKQGGHGEMFKDLATLLARGAEGLRDMYVKRKDVPPSIEHDPRAIKDSIRSALTNSVDIDGFRHRLEMANMPDDVLNSIGALWDNRETVIENAGRSKFSDLSRADQKQTDDIHTDYTTKRDELGFGDNKPKKDISWLSRFFNVLNVQKEIHSNKDIGPMLSWILSNSNKIINDGSHVYKDLNQHLEPYRDLSTKSQGRLIQAAIDFDSTNSKELTDKGLQWATEDMLRRKGLNDAEIHAYNEITHALDKAWDLVEMLFREQGMDPPKRIPGYFPHLWYGSYRLAFRNAEGAIVRMKSFSTAWHRAAYEKLFKSKFEGELKSEHIDPKDEPRTNDMLGSIIDRLSLDLNRPLDKVLADKIERAERFATQGIVTELIERRANLGGHIAEDGVKPFGQLHLKQNNRLLNAYNKYIQDISHFYANTRIANEVLKPFNKDVTAGTYENVPHFVEAMQEFVGRATGHPTNHLKFVDMIARSMMRGIGMPPNGLNAFLRGGSQLLYYTKLTAFSPLYVGSQILQPVVAARNIYRVHQERVVLNGQRGNPLTALGYGLKEYVSLRQGQGTPETRAVMKYLEDKGIIDSRQMENIDASNLVQKGLNVASAGISKFLEATETHNRTAMTLMFYKYFRDSGMDTMHAIRAAATQMGLGMGEYARQHQAGMYTDLGMTGQQMKPFATLKNTYLGETYMNLQVVADAVREAKAGNVPPHVIATSILPLALASMNLVFFAGLAGTIGAQEYNAIVKFHNFLFPDNPMLDLGAKLRDMGFSTPWIYGMLGTSLPGKPNIGPSLNAPGVTDMGGFPGPTALYHTAAMVPELIHYMRGETVDYESLSAHLQRVAPGWAGQMFAEWAAKHQGGNVSSASNFNVNKVKRTPEQSDVARLTGRANIDEQSIRDQNTLDDRSKKQDSAWVGQQVKILTNLVEGYPGPDLKTTIDNIIAQKRGVGDEIIDRILELHTKRMQDTDTQNRMEIANAGSAAKMQRLKQIYDMLHGK